MSPYSTSTTYITSPESFTYRIQVPATPYHGTQGQVWQSATMSPLSTPIMGFHNPYPAVFTASPPNSPDWRVEGPPPLDHNRSPYACVPLPRLSNGPVFINPLLEHTPTSMLDYDVTQAPAFAKMNARRRDTLNRSLDEPACSPPLTSLTIRTSLSNKPIVIHKNGAVVTVRDVLSGIHDALRTFALEQNHPTRQMGLWSVPHQDQFHTTVEMRMHQMMLAFLANRVRWAGLSASSSEPDVWILHVR